MLSHVTSVCYSVKCINPCIIIQSLKQHCVASKGIVSLSSIYPKSLLIVPTSGGQCIFIYLIIPRLLFPVSDKCLALMNPFQQEIIGTTYNKVEQLPRFVAQGEFGLVCKFLQHSYGLKQSPRTWFRKFSYTMQSFGLKQSEADRSFNLLLSNFYQKMCLSIYLC